MFIIFIMLLAASLAAVSAHLYTALTLQAQTVEYAVQAVKLEHYTRGVLAYAISEVAHTVTLQQHIARKKEASAMCNLFNNSANGFIKGFIIYKRAPHGYFVEVSMVKAGEKAGGVRAHIIRDVGVEKVVYSCVALEAF